MTTGNSNPRTGQNSLTISFSFVAGIGVILMIAAAMIGVVEGDAADNTLIGGLFAAGIAMLILGAGAWAGIVKPWENIDDINMPQYTGHHHEDDHASEDH